MKQEGILADNQAAAAAVITNIQRYSLHDGPGLRTILFLKGCPLSCLWCSNPETQAKYPQMLYSRTQCIACGECVRVCPEGAFTKKEGGIAFDKARCRDCGACADECPTGAASMSGRKITVDEAVNILEADSVFFRRSGGGVTVSGGEPSTYPEFTAELLRRIRTLNMHTAVETCGYAEWNRLWTTVQYADLVLSDLKTADPVMHKQYTGTDNAVILENAEKLAGSKEVIFRIPVIPGFTATEANLNAIAQFIAGLGREFAVNLLPYHAFGTGKYRSLGMRYELEGLLPPGEEEMENFREIFSRQGLKAVVF